MCASSLVTSFSFAGEVEHDAHRAAHVDIRFDMACALVHREAADGDLLADDGGLIGDERFDRLTRRKGGGKERFDVLRLRRRDLLCDRLDQGVESVALGNEVGLAVDFDEHTRIAFDVGIDDALCGDLGSAFCSLRDAALAEKIRSLVHIALCIDKGLLAIHHACARLFTERHDVLCGKFCHCCLPPKKLFLNGSLSGLCLFRGSCFLLSGSCIERFALVCLDDGVGDDGRDELDRADRIVVAGMTWSMRSGSSWYR